MISPNPNELANEGLDQLSEAKPHNNTSITK